MLDLNTIHTHLGEWLGGGGTDSDIVLSTRIRLARNVVEFPFLTQASPRQRTELEGYLRENIEAAELENDLLYANLNDASILDRTCLVERHLISKDHARAEGDRGVAIGENEALSIMVNEEDHLRIQVLRSGFEARQAWEQIVAIDDRLESRLTYAFNPDFGYLTACPTNVGTAMRVSVMLHLPALVLTKQIEKVFQAVSKINLAVRGFYGEGTQASGDFYQISNQVTLGRSEEAILDGVMDVVPQIVRYERNIRHALISENKVSLEDRVWRALGILQHARTITSEETMELLSVVRMGVNLGLIKHLDIASVNTLFIQTQPAHLQKMEGQRLDTGRRDELRASFIRSRLPVG